MVPRREHPLLLRFSFAGRKRRRMKALFKSLEGALVSELKLLLDLRVLHHDETPMLRIAAARRPGARFDNFADQFIWNRVRLQPAHRAHRPHRVKQFDFPIHPGEPLREYLQRSAYCFG
jgi:hypothetical protein